MEKLRRCVVVETDGRGSTEEAKETSRYSRDQSSGEPVRQGIDSIPRHRSSGAQDGSFDDGSITIPNEEEQYGTVMATRSIINGSNRLVSRRGAHLSSIGRHILDGLSCSDALAVGSDFRITIRSITSREERFEFTYCFEGVAQDCLPNLLLKLLLQPVKGTDDTQSTLLPLWLQSKLVGACIP